MNAKNDARLFNFPHIVVVEASAGSGKTYCLAKRYLQLLIHPHFKSESTSLNTILAITFTNKATFEMKERILELLKKIALDAFSNKQEEDDIIGLLGIDKKSAQVVAYRLVDELIRHYNSFQVKTIDSFINTLLLCCALSIDRSASFKIKRNYSSYLAYCLDLAIEQAVSSEEVFKFLEEFLNHYLFVENRKGWFPKEDILKLMQSLFQLSNKYGQLFQVYEAQTNEVIKRKRYLYQRIKELSRQFPPGLKARAAKSIFIFLEKSKDIFDIADLPSALKSPEAIMGKGKVVPLDFKKKWRTLYKELQALIELDANVTYSPYIKLFYELLEFLQQTSKKEDVLFLEELNKKARLLFGAGGISVAEVYYRLATRFRHYLIDEFQDTSVLQWRNLEPMIEDALSSGGSLFYVGDKKQAIYRFRGGEAGLFDALKESFSHFNVRLSSLTKNWRSQKTIVEFNNKIFSADNLLNFLKNSGINKELRELEGATEEIVDVFKDASQESKVGNDFGYLYIERINDMNQEERNKIMQPKIIKLIKELQKRFKYEDIAILARDNTEVELISSWLLAENISVESEKTLNVLQNHLIKDIISFLQFLHSPIDDLSFAAFILGKIFSRATGISNKETTNFLFKLRRERKYTTPLALYHLFRKSYPDIWKEYFEYFFKSVGFVSVYELTITIYNRFQVLENFKHQQAFFMKFLELIKQSEDEHIGIAEFLAYLKEAALEDLYVNVIHTDSVKVLTIHKSKGLEFPVVIIPFLRMEITPEIGRKGSSLYLTTDISNNLKLLRITKTHRQYSPILQKIYAQAYKTACIDELNNIYVALTRAQYELYIFIPKKSAIANNKAHYLIPPQIEEEGSQRQYEVLKKDISRPIITIEPSVYKDWLKQLRDEFGPALSPAQREKILEGNIMHTILSYIGNCANQQREELIKRAIQLTQSAYPAIRDLEKYQEKIKQLLSKKELRDIFYVLKGEVFCEKEIVNQFGDLKRIDRLIVKDKGVLIIDYKSSAEVREKHLEQLHEYIKIIKEIYPSQEVKGVLVYLDEMEKEEVA